MNGLRIADVMDVVGTADAEVLRELEESLWRTQTRFDRGYLERVLHPEFFEFGRSGRQWTRAETLGAERLDIAVELYEFAVHEVSAGVALVTYISVVHGDPMLMSNRSSVWVRDSDSWKLRFHQGTPVHVT